MCYTRPMTNKFEILSLKSELLNNLRELKFHSMTPIQASALPLVLDGSDVIAQAKTGSGKTAAFGLGILNSMDMTSTHSQALVLCPTRELAEQVATEIRSLARMIKNTKVLTLCGGVHENHQIKSLSHGAHIVVGTPGRILRLLKHGALDLRIMDTLVLDEADRMLHMGFHDDIMKISAYLPNQRQTLLFSATFPEGIQKLSKNIQTEASFIKVDSEHLENSIEQKFYEVESHKDKEDVLLNILAIHRPKRSIVFCKTKEITKNLTRFLKKKGIFAEGIHGDLDQNERNLILTKFSNESLSILVATDVAARGLDITDLAAVVNFDLPNDPEVYTHRIGRTGRAGKSGLAFSLLMNKERYKLDPIEEVTNKKYKINNLSELDTENKFDLTPPMKTMYIGGGKKNKLRPGDILGALVGLAKINSEDVGEITISNILSYVAIKAALVDQAIEKLENGKIKNKKFKIGIA
jgi:ATP-dependent RNA helicase DbpA